MQDAQARHARYLIIALVIAAAVLSAGVAALRHRSDIRELMVRGSVGPVPEPISRADLFDTANDDTGASGAGDDVGSVDTHDAASRSASADDATPDDAVSGTPTTPIIPALPQPTNPRDTSDVASATIPAQLNLRVPFVSQAPHGVWDAIHDDACEEASLIMLYAYLNDVPSVTLDDAEALIQALVARQMDMFGYFESTDAAQTVALAHDFFDDRRLVVKPLTHIDDLKRELARGYPVIIPADGKALRNPFFRGDGPTYHMFVAKGYTETHIITNEPGTRRGADYPYTYATIMSAARDWNSGDVRNGASVMIVVE